MVASGGRRSAHTRERRFFMGRIIVPRYLAALEISRLADADAHTLVGNIKVAAPTSALVLASPAMQASVTALGTKDATLEKANTAVDNDKQALKIDLSTE